MFVSAPDRRLTRERDPAALAALAALAERTRPVSASRTRLLPVVPALAELLPDGALRRGQELELHVNLLRHGRRTCHARTPECGQCALARMCPSKGLENVRLGASRRKR